MRQRTIRGTSWILAGRIIRAPISVIVTAILARLLLPADFGTIAFVTTVTGLATAIFDGGIGINLVRRANLEPGERATTLTVTVALSLILMAVALVGAGPLERWMAMPHLAATLSAIALTLPVTAGASVFNAILQRYNHFRALVLASLASQVTYGILAVCLALAGFGIWSLTLGLIAGVTVETTLNAWSARGLMDWHPRAALLQKVVTDGTAFTAVKVLGWGSAGFDKLAAGHLGAAAVGQYSRAAALFVIANQALGAGLMRALLSSFAQISGERERLGKAYLRVVELMLLLSALVAAIVLLFAPELVRILLGAGWSETIMPLRILFLAFVARCMNSAAEAVTATVASNRQNILRQAAQLTFVVLFVTASLSYGIVGVAAGFAGAIWAFYVVNVAALKRWLRLPPAELARAHARPLALVAPAIAAGLAFVTFADDRLGLLGRLALGSSTCVLAFALTLHFAPHRWLGQDLADARKALRSRLLRPISSPLP